MPSISYLPFIKYYLFELNGKNSMLTTFISYLQFLTFQIELIISTLSFFWHSRFWRSGGIFWSFHFYISGALEEYFSHIVSIYLVLSFRRSDPVSVCYLHNQNFNEKSETNFWGKKFSGIGKRFRV